MRGSMTFCFVWNYAAAVLWGHSLGFSPCFWHLIIFFAIHNNSTHFVFSYCPAHSSNSLWWLTHLGSLIQIYTTGSPRHFLRDSVLRRCTLSRKTRLSLLLVHRTSSIFSARPDFNFTASSTSHPRFPLSHATFLRYLSFVEFLTFNTATYPAS